MDQVPFGPFDVLVAFVSFWLVQAILAGHHQGVSLGHPGVAGAVLSAGLLLCVCALLGLALGAVIRHTAGGIAATVAVILVPAILALLPAPWNGRLGRFTLLEAARQVSALHPATNLLSPGWSLLVLLAWPAGAGVTLVPGLAARRLPPRVRLVPPAEPVTRRVFTVSRRGGDRKPAVRVVLDALSAAAA